MKPVGDIAVATVVVNVVVVSFITTLLLVNVWI